MIKNLVEFKWLFISAVVFSINSVNASPVSDVELDDLAKQELALAKGKVKPSSQSINSSDLGIVSLPPSDQEKSFAWAGRLGANFTSFQSSGNVKLPTGQMISLSDYDQSYALGIEFDYPRLSIGNSLRLSGSLLGFTAQARRDIELNSSYVIRDVRLVSFAYALGVRAEYEVIDPFWISARTGLGEVKGFQTGSSSFVRADFSAPALFSRFALGADLFDRYYFSIGYRLLSPLGDLELAKNNNLDISAGLNF